jgi:hypothetical protein
MEFQSLLMQSLFTWTHIYPAVGYVPLQRQEFHDLRFYTSKDIGVHVIHILQLTLFYNVFINNPYLCMAKSLMCVFPCWLLQYHHCHVLFYFLSLLFYVVVTVSYRCTHVTPTIYGCVISVSVIHSSKILCLWSLAYRSCMYVAIVSIKMCLSINDIRKCGDEYKIAWKVDIELGWMCSISIY